VVHFVKQGVCLCSVSSSSVFISFVIADRTNEGKSLFRFFVMPLSLLHAVLAIVSPHTAPSASLMCFYLDAQALR
jgi:hypothetical protein